MQRSYVAPISSKRKHPLDTEIIPGINEAASTDLKFCEAAAEADLCDRETSDDRGGELPSHLEDFLKTRIAKMEEENECLKR